MPITEQKLQEHRHYMRIMAAVGGDNRARRLVNRGNVHTHEPRRKPWNPSKNVTHWPKGSLGALLEAEHSVPLTINPHLR